jgi:hypothetical protein
MPGVPDAFEDIAPLPPADDSPWSLREYVQGDQAGKEQLLKEAEERQKMAMLKADRPAQDTDAVKQEVKAAVPRWTEVHERSICGHASTLLACTHAHTQIPRANVTS